MCIFAINVDKGQMETSLRQANSESAIARKSDMAAICTKLACLVHHASVKVARMCVLTAFALKPTEESYESIGKFYGNKHNCCNNCSKNGNADPGVVNPATLYEVERLLNMLRPEYLSPESTLSDIEMLCKRYLQDRLSSSKNIFTSLPINSSQVEGPGKKKADSATSKSSNLFDAISPLEVSNSQVLLSKLRLQQQIQSSQSGQTIKNVIYSQVPKPTSSQLISVSRGWPPILQTGPRYSSPDAVKTHQTGSAFDSSKQTNKQTIPSVSANVNVSFPGSVKKDQRVKILSQSQRPSLQQSVVGMPSSLPQRQISNLNEQNNAFIPGASQSLNQPNKEISHGLLNIMKPGPGVAQKAFAPRHQKSSHPLSLNLLQGSRNPHQANSQRLPTVSTLLKPAHILDQQRQPTSKSLTCLSISLPSSSSSLSSSSSSSSPYLLGTFRNQAQSHPMRNSNINTAEKQKHVSIQHTKSQAENLRNLMQATMSGLPQQKQLVFSKQMAGAGTTGTPQSSQGHQLNAALEKPTALPKTTVEMAHQTALANLQAKVVSKTQQQQLHYQSGRLDAEQLIQRQATHRQQHQFNAESNQQQRQLHFISATDNSLNTSHLPSQNNITCSVEAGLQADITNGQNPSALPSDELSGSIVGIDDTIIKELLQDSGIFSNTFPDIEVEDLTKKGQESAQSKGTSLPSGRVNSPFRQSSMKGQGMLIESNLTRNNPGLSNMRKTSASNNVFLPSYDLKQNLLQLYDTTPRSSYKSHDSSSSTVSHKQYPESLKHSSFSQTTRVGSNTVTVEQLREKMRREQIEGEVMMDASNNATYRCIICSLAFAELEELREHVRNVCKPGLQSSSVYNNKIEQDKVKSAKAGLETTTVFQCLRCFELCISDAGIKEHRLTCKRVPTVPPDIKNATLKGKTSPSASSSRSSTPKTPVLKKEIKDNSSKVPDMPLPFPYPSLNTKGVLESLSAAAGKCHTQTSPKPATASGSRPTTSSPRPAGSSSPRSATSSSPRSATSSSPWSATTSSSRPSTSTSPRPTSAFSGGNANSNTQNAALTSKSLSLRKDSSSAKVSAKDEKPKPLPSPSYSEISGSGGSKFFRCKVCSQTLCSMESLHSHWKECFMKNPTKEKKPVHKQFLYEADLEPGEIRPLLGQVLENVTSIIAAVAQGRLGNTSDFDSDAECSDFEALSQLKDPCKPMQVSAKTIHSRGSISVFTTTTQGGNHPLANKTLTLFPHSLHNKTSKEYNLIPAKRSSVRRRSEDTEGSSSQGKGGDDSQSVSEFEVEDDEKPELGRETPPKLRDRKTLKPIQSFINESFVSPYCKLGQIKISKPKNKMMTSGEKHAPAKTTSEESEEENYVCIACRKRFQSERILVQHYAGKHLQPYTMKTMADSTSYFCHLCQKTFTTFKQYMLHVPNHSAVIFEKMKRSSHAKGSASPWSQRLASSRGFLHNAKKSKLSPKMASALRSKKKAAKSVRDRLRKCLSKKSKAHTSSPLSVDVENPMVDSVRKSPRHFGSIPAKEVLNKNHRTRNQHPLVRSFPQSETEDSCLSSNPANSDDEDYSASDDIDSDSLPSAPPETRNRKRSSQSVSCIDEVKKTRFSISCSTSSLEKNPKYLPVVSVRRMSAQEIEKYSKPKSFEQNDHIEKDGVSTEPQPPISASLSSFQASFESYIRQAMTSSTTDKMTHNQAKPLSSHENQRLDSTLQNSNNKHGAIKDVDAKNSDEIRPLNKEENSEPGGSNVCLDAVCEEEPYTNTALPALPDTNQMLSALTKRRCSVNLGQKLDVNAIQPLKDCKDNSAPNAVKACSHESQQESNPTLLPVLCSLPSCAVRLKRTELADKFLALKKEGESSLNVSSDLILDLSGENDSRISQHNECKNHQMEHHVLVSVGKESKGREEEELQQNAEMSINHTAVEQGEGSFLKTDRKLLKSPVDFNSDDNTIDASTMGESQLDLAPLSSHLPDSKAEGDNLNDSRTSQLSCGFSDTVVETTHSDNDYQHRKGDSGIPGKCIHSTKDMAVQDLTTSVKVDHSSDHMIDDDDVVSCGEGDDSISKTNVHVPGAERSIADGLTDQCEDSVCSSQLEESVNDVKKAAWLRDVEGNHGVGEIKEKHGFKAVSGEESLTGDKKEGSPVCNLKDGISLTDEKSHDSVEGTKGDDYVNKMESVDLDTNIKDDGHGPDTNIKDDGHGPDTNIKDDGHGPDTDMKDDGHGPDTDIKDDGHGPDTDIKDDGHGPDTDMKDDGHGPDTDMKDDGHGPDTDMKDGGNGPDTDIKDNGHGPDTDVKDDGHGPVTDMKDGGNGPVTDVKGDGNGPDTDMKGDGNGPVTDMKDDGNGPDTDMKDDGNGPVTNKKGDGNGSVTDMKDDGNGPDTDMKGNGPDTDMKGKGNGPDTNKKGDGNGPDTDMKGNGPVIDMKGDGNGPVTDMKGDGNGPVTDMKGDGNGPVTDMKGDEHGVVTDMDGHGPVTDMKDDGHGPDTVMKVNGHSPVSDMKAEENPLGEVKVDGSVPNMTEDDSVCDTKDEAPLPDMKEDDFMHEIQDDCSGPGCEEKGDNSVGHQVNISVVNMKSDGSVADLKPEVKADSVSDMKNDGLVVDVKHSDLARNAEDEENENAGDKDNVAVRCAEEKNYICDVKDAFPKRDIKDNLSSVKDLKSVIIEDLEKSPIVKNGLTSSLEPKRVVMEMPPHISSGISIQSTTALREEHCLSTGENVSSFKSTDQSMETCNETSSIDGDMPSGILDLAGDSQVEGESNARVHDLHNSPKVVPDVFANVGDRNAGVHTCHGPKSGLGSPAKVDVNVLPCRVVLSDVLETYSCSSGQVTAHESEGDFKLAEPLVNISILKMIEKKEEKDEEQMNERQDNNLKVDTGCVQGLVTDTLERLRDGTHGQGELHSPEQLAQSKEREKISHWPQSANLVGFHIQSHAHLNSEGDHTDVPTLKRTFKTSSPEKVNTPSPEKVNTPSPEKVNTPSPENAKTPSPEKVNTPSPEKVNTPSPEKVNTPSPEKVNTPSPEKVNTPSPEDANTPSPDNANIQSPEKVSTPSPEDANTPSPDNANTQSPEKVSSPSPEDANSSEEAFNTNTKTVSSCGKVSASFACDEGKSEDQVTWAVCSNVKACQEEKSGDGSLVEEACQEEKSGDGSLVEEACHEIHNVEDGESSQHFFDLQMSMSGIKTYIEDNGKMFDDDSDDNSDANEVLGDLPVGTSCADIRSVIDRHLSEKIEEDYVHIMDSGCVEKKDGLPSVDVEFQPATTGSNIIEQNNSSVKEASLLDDMLLSQDVSLLEEKEADGPADGHKALVAPLGTIHLTSGDNIETLVEEDHTSKPMDTGWTIHLTSGDNIETLVEEDHTSKPMDTGWTDELDKIPSASPTFDWQRKDENTENESGVREKRCGDEGEEISCPGSVSVEDINNEVAVREEHSDFSQSVSTVLQDGQDCTEFFDQTLPTNENTQMTNYFQTTSSDISDETSLCPLASSSLDNVNALGPVEDDRVNLEEQVQCKEMKENENSGLLDTMDRDKHAVSSTHLSEEMEATDGITPLYPTNDKEDQDHTSEVIFEQPVEGETNNRSCDSPKDAFGKADEALTTMDDTLCEPLVPVAIEQNQSSEQDTNSVQSETEAQAKTSPRVEAACVSNDDIDVLQDRGQVSPKSINSCTFTEKSMTPPEVSCDECQQKPAGEEAMEQSSEKSCAKGECELEANLTSVDIVPEPKMPATHHVKGEEKTVEEEACRNDEVPLSLESDLNRPPRSSGREQLENVTRGQQNIEEEDHQFSKLDALPLHSFEDRGEVGDDNEESDGHRQVFRESMTDWMEDPFDLLSPKHKPRQDVGQHQDKSIGSICVEEKDVLHSTRSKDKDAQVNPSEGRPTALNEQKAVNQMVEGQGVLDSTEPGKLSSSSYDVDEDNLSDYDLVIEEDTSYNKKVFIQTDMAMALRCESDKTEEAVTKTRTTCHNQRMEEEEPLTAKWHTLSRGWKSLKEKHGPHPFEWDDCEEEMSFREPKKTALENTRLLERKRKALKEKLESSPFMWDLEDSPEKQDHLCAQKKPMINSDSRKALTFDTPGEAVNKVKIAPAKREKSWKRVPKNSKSDNSENKEEPQPKKRLLSTFMRSVPAVSKMRRQASVANSKSSPAQSQPAKTHMGIGQRHASNELSGHTIKSTVEGTSAHTPNVPSVKDVIVDEEISFNTKSYSPIPPDLSPGKVESKPVPAHPPKRPRGRSKKTSSSEKELSHTHALRESVSEETRSRVNNPNNVTVEKAAIKRKQRDTTPLSEPPKKAKVLSSGKSTDPLTPKLKKAGLIRVTSPATMSSPSPSTDNALPFTRSSEAALKAFNQKSLRNREVGPTEKQSTPGTPKSPHPRRSQENGKQGKLSSPSTPSSSRPSSTQVTNSHSNNSQASRKVGKQVSSDKSRNEAATGAVVRRRTPSLPRKNSKELFASASKRNKQSTTSTTIYRVDPLPKGVSPKTATSASKAFGTVHTPLPPGVTTVNSKKKQAKSKWKIDKEMKPTKVKSKQLRSPISFRKT